MKEILAIVYIVAGWLAANRTIFANRAFITFGAEGYFRLILWKFFAAIFLGWVLIPVAIIKAIANR